MRNPFRIAYFKPNGTRYTSGSDCSSARVARQQLKRIRDAAVAKGRNPKLIAIESFIDGKWEIYE